MFISRVKDTSCRRLVSRTNSRGEVQLVKRISLDATSITAPCESMRLLVERVLPRSEADFIAVRSIIVKFAIRRELRKLVSDVKIPP